MEKNETGIKVVHITDIHFAESEFWTGVNNKRVMHRHGHDIQALIALDQVLKKIDWDLMIVSGDLTRVGHIDSFSYVSNWLYGTINAPGSTECIGLGLKRDGGRCFVIPGNHDRFNDKLMQGSLDNYNSYFPPIPGRKLETTTVKGVPVNILLFDSTYEDGGFARGFVPPAAMTNWTSSPEALDIVVVHHHLAQAPEHRRNKSLEIVNAGQFVGFLLSRKVDAILFGHTHESFFANVSADLVRQPVKHPKKWHRWMKRLVPRRVSNEALSLAFERVPTKSGKFTTFNSFFEYLYIKNVLEIDIMGPEYFETPSKFYAHLGTYQSDFAEQLERIRERRVALSMSPSPTYAESAMKGFHLLEFTKEKGQFACSCIPYGFDGATFVKS